MVIVISRKDLNKQAFDKAIIKDATDCKKCSLMGFAEAMYYFYKNDAEKNEERDWRYGKG